MLFGERQCCRFISRHYVEVQQSLRTLHPCVEDMYSVGLRMSHREISSFVVHQKNSNTIRLITFPVMGLTQDRLLGKSGCRITETLSTCPITRWHCAGSAGVKLQVYGKLYGLHGWAIGKHWQDAQKGCPARPQRVKTGGVLSGVR
jgi:hypothetical protein